MCMCVCECVCVCVHVCVTFEKLINFLKRLYVKVMFQWAGMKISQAYIKYFRFFALKLGCLSTGRNILVGGMSVSGQ